jgi:hypothetical protein
MFKSLLKRLLPRKDGESPAAPPPRIYDPALLHLLLNRVYNLPSVSVDKARPATINVLVPAFDFRSISAGFFGVFEVARFLRCSGLNVRLVLFDNFEFDPAEFSRKLADYPGLERLAEEVEIDYIGERRAPLTVSPDDVSLATVWYSAYFAEKIARVTGGRGFIYLIQDYETNFFPGSTQSSLADATYAMNYCALFSTEMLKTFFLSSDVGGIRSRGLPNVFFNNACSSHLSNWEDFARLHAAKEKRRLVFYCRPNVHRNMFELAALAVATAFRSGILSPDKWECVAIGLGDATLEIGNGQRVSLQPRMSLREYIAATESFDVCLSLMASPHPSLVPMDMAGSGVITVTNTFACKDAAYFQSISGNIIPVAPTLPALLAAIDVAARRSADLKQRHSNALNMTYPRSWEKSLTGEHQSFIQDSIAWCRDAV